MIANIYILHRAIEEIGPDWFKIEDIPAKFYPKNGHNFTVGEPVTLTVETTNANDQQNDNPRKGPSGGEGPGSGI